MNQSEVIDHRAAAPWMIAVDQRIAAASAPGGVACHDLAMPADDSRDSKALSPLRMIGGGTEFAGTCAVMCLLGYWLDSVFGTAPWLLVVGAVIGFVSATWVLLRSLTGSSDSRDGTSR